MCSAQTEVKRKKQKISLLKKTEEKKEKELKKEYHALLVELEKKVDMGEKSISSYQGFVIVS